MATLLESAQINKREDLSDLISIADASATVFSTMIPKGAELGNRKFEWQVDSYDTASSASVVDGSDVLFTDTDNTGAAQNYIIDPRKAAARINNHGHYWRRAFRVSPLAAESNAAGYKSEIANGLAKKTIELKRDIEKTLLGTQAWACGLRPLSPLAALLTVQPRSARMTRRMRLGLALPLRSLCLLVAARPRRLAH